MMKVAAVTVIDEDDSIDNGVIEEDNLLQLVTSESKESYKDVKISDTLTDGTKKEVAELVHER